MKSIDIWLLYGSNVAASLRRIILQTTIAEVIEMLYANFIHFSGYVKISEASCVFYLLKKVTVQ